MTHTFALEVRQFGAWRPMGTVSYSLVDGDPDASLRAAFDDLNNRLNLRCLVDGLEPGSYRIKREAPDG